MLSCSPICFATDWQRSIMKPIGRPVESVNEKGGASSRKAIRSALSCRTLSSVPAFTDPRANAAPAAAKDHALSRRLIEPMGSPLEIPRGFTAGRAPQRVGAYNREKGEEPKRVSVRRISCDNLLKLVFSAVSE